MFTDDTILTFGRYKFWRLKEIPAYYFLHIHNNGGSHSPELNQYIKENLTAITARAEQEVITPVVDFVDFICEKITFPTEKEAKFRLKTIKARSKEDKKPLRAYECPACGGWHLTSEPKKKK